MLQFVTLLLVGAEACVVIEVGVAVLGARDVFLYRMFSALLLFLPLNHSLWLGWLATPFQPILKARANRMLINNRGQSSIYFCAQPLG